MVVFSARPLDFSGRGQREFEEKTSRLTAPKFFKESEYDLSGHVTTSSILMLYLKSPCSKPPSKQCLGLRDIFGQNYGPNCISRARRDTEFRIGTFTVLTGFRPRQN